MLALTLKNLPKSVEKELVKKLEYLETTTKAKSSHLAEILIRNIKSMENIQEKQEVELVINLPKEWADHLIHLEKTTKKSKDDYIKEALFRYLEEIEETKTVRQSKSALVKKSKN